MTNEEHNTAITERSIEKLYDLINDLRRVIERSISSVEESSARIRLCVEYYDTMKKHYNRY